MASEPEHCCSEESPRPRENAPGQPSLRTRVDSWAQFRARMIAALSTQIVPPDGEPTAPRPLRALSTRASDDATLALIDAWAASCDVLAFYGERILNEGYLATAAERHSVVEIARMFGYEPSPGVAASARLALTMQDSALARGDVQLEPGIAVMSVPPEGKLPQVFETVEGLRARVEYNRLVPRLTQPHAIGDGDDQLWLQGIATRLEPGQLLVIARPERATSRSAAFHAARVVSLHADQAAQRTRVRFAPEISGFGASVTEPLVLVFRQRAGIFGWNAPDFNALSSELKGTYLEHASYDLGPLFRLFEFEAAESSLGGMYSVPLVSQQEWPGFAIGSAGGEPKVGGIHLDRETDVIAPASFVYLVDADGDLLGRVEAIGVASRVDFTLTGKVTTVSFDDDATALSTFDRRATIVHIASEQLLLAEAPISSPLSGLALALSSTIPELEVGRTLLVTGTPAAGGDPVVLEVVVAACTSVDGRSVITLQEELAVELERTSVVIFANTALATHGSRVASEAIGSGDASVANQRFRLRHAPLTWISAASASGAEASLELRVDGVLWTRVESLYAAGPHDRVYTLAHSETSCTEVVFGDGVRGARLPTGNDNVVASYRRGLGLDGEVGAQLLTLLQTRPIGLFAATNPAAASGAADPETLDDARRNAPLRMLTLDRLVSLSDYGDFARAFAGVGKARATELWDGRRAFVQLTVASASGQPFAPGDAVLDALAQAIRGLGDPTHVVRIDSHVEVPFRVLLKLASDPVRVRADVEAAVRAALIAAYSFGARDFGQPVPLSEVAAVVHGVAGVLAVDVDALWVGSSKTLSAVLRAELPRWTGGAVTRAELLLIDPAAIFISEMPT